MSSEKSRYDFRMSLKYFHDKKICSSTIDNYNRTYVPMVWGYWKNTKINIADEAQYILGFNEPNHREQSNMTPEKAAAAWRQVEKNSKGKPLVSPSAAHCHKNCLSSEIEWFDKFFALCKGCRVDFLAAHTYWCNPYKVMTYLKSLYKKYRRKIWLTEFACSTTLSPSRQLRFMQQILPELQKADFIYRYSWYSARIKESGFITTAASLLEPDRSSLTSLGQFYNNFQGTKIKVTTAQPRPAPTEAPKEKTTKPNSGEDTSKVGRDELLLILQSYKQNPTKLGTILSFMKSNSNKLSDAVQAIYNTSSNKLLRQRIKKRFKEVVCADVNTLPDKEIRELVENIRKLPAQGTEGKKKKKKAGELRVPKCPK